MSSQNTECSLTTDEEDSDTPKSGPSYKERRREAHTQAEQKRRDAIKKGYEELQVLVPTCNTQDSVSSYKLSKAAILQRSIEYIQTLQQKQMKREKELKVRRKEVLGLKIMKDNYDEMVRQQQQQQQQQADRQAASQAANNFGSGSSSQQQISDEMKFEVFKAVCESLFQSFDSSVSVTDFTELSGCTIAWLEEHCKPQNLRQIVVNILEQLKSQSAG